MAWTWLAVAVCAALVLLCSTLVGILRRDLHRQRALVDSLESRLSAAEHRDRVDPPQPAGGSGRDEGAVRLITGVRAGGGGADAPLGAVTSASFVGPLIKVAAVAHGVRRALDDEQRMRIAWAMKKELRRQRKLSRRRGSKLRAAGRHESKGWTP